MGDETVVDEGLSMQWLGWVLIAAFLGCMLGLLLGQLLHELGRDR